MVIFWQNPGFFYIISKRIMKRRDDFLSKSSQRFVLNCKNSDNIPLSRAKTAASIQCRLSRTLNLNQTNLKSVNDVDSAQARFGLSSYINEIEEQLKQDLDGCNTYWDEFFCYRDALSSLIDHFDKYKEPLMRLKNGYDKLIDSLHRDVQHHTRKALEVEKSHTSINYELHNQAKKKEAKEESYQKLLSLIRRDIVAVESDVTSLLNDVSTQINNINISNEAINSNSLYLRNLQIQLNDLSNEFQRRNSALQEMNMHYNDSVSEISHLRIEITDLLDKILKNRYSIQTHTHRIDEIRVLKDNKEIILENQKSSIEQLLNRTKQEEEELNIITNRIEEELEKSNSLHSSLVLLHYGQNHRQIIRDDHNEENNIDLIKSFIERS